MASSYINTLEKKLAEVTGINVDAIRKNQWNDLAAEEQDIKESEKFINSIVVTRAAVASPSEINPLIAKTFELVKRELGENGGEHSLPALAYGYDGLAPHLTVDVMTVHHTKHHQGYINNLNKAWVTYQAGLAAGDNAAVNSLAGAILFNGGSHLNHSIFWTNMKSNAGEEIPVPTGSIGDQINKDFGSFEEFKTKFTATTAAIKGSGWGWLGYDKAADKLGIYTTANQDTVEIIHGAVPMMTCDVWEHAYYLQYKNLRASFIGGFFKLMNWENIQSRFDAAKSC